MMTEKIKVTDANRKEFEKLINDFCKSMQKYNVAIFVCAGDADEKPEFDVLVASNIEPIHYTHLFKKVLRHSFPAASKKVDEILSSIFDKEKNEQSVKSKKDFPS